MPMADCRVVCPYRPIQVFAISDTIFVMNLRQLNQFLMVAETLNFRKAAERLHMAQPPLSVSIKRLEQDLGVTLFMRERRGLRLTTVGQTVLDHARQIQFHAKELRKAAQEADQGIGGRLSIGFVGSATYKLFPQALPLFREKYPHVVLDLKELTTTRILREVESNDLDLGIVRYPLIEATQARLQPVEPDQLVLVLSKHSPLVHRKRLGLKDLADQPFVMYSASLAANMRAQVVTACQAVGFTPHVAQEAVQVQTMLSLVESGMGVALVPSICQVQASKALTFRTLTQPANHLGLALAVATNARTEPPAARRFRELLVDLDRRRSVNLRAR